MYQNPSNQSVDDLLTEDEAAQIRRQSPRTLQAERLCGAGCPYIKLGRSIRYRRGDILDYIEANRRNIIGAGR